MQGPLLKQLMHVIPFIEHLWTSFLTHAAGNLLSHLLMICLSHAKNLFFSLDVKMNPSFSRLLFLGFYLRYSTLNFFL